MTVAQDFTGKKFGRLTIIGEGQKKGKHRRLICKCTCGVQKEMYLTVIKAGAKSCGCLQREVATTHGQSRSNNPLYGIWTNMKSRCYSPTAKYYPEYGGRGITVCDEWLNDFPAFESWARSSGYAKGLSIDRENNQLGYTPENCRWVTSTTQQRNRRGAKGSSSKYIGVSFLKRNQKWQASIKHDGKGHFLGYFPTELEAAKARDKYIIDNGLTDFTLNGVLP